MIDDRWLRTLCSPANPKQAWIKQTQQCWISISLWPFEVSKAVCSLTWPLYLRLSISLGCLISEPCLFLQVRERGIRSQFACTYMDDGEPLIRVLDFPSTSQLPTCVHPAPKPTVPSAVNASLEHECNPADKCKKQGTPFQNELQSFLCSS